MKKYIERRLNEAKIAAFYGVDGYEKIGKKNQEELEKVHAYLFDSSNVEYLQDRLSQLDRMVDAEYFDFIKRIYAICLTNPLLETESTLSYPDLCSMKKEKSSDIINFVNMVFSSEYPTLPYNIVDKFNFKIFSPSFIKRIKTGSGTIVVFRDFDTKERIMVLERFNNVRDFIYSAGSAVELLERPINEKYSSALNVMKYFMRSRSAAYMTTIEAQKQERIAFDNIVYGARHYAEALSDMSVEEFNALPVHVKVDILDIVDRVVGYCLAQSNNISLQTLVFGDIMKDSGANLASIGTSYDEVEQTFTKVSDDLKSHAYTLKK